MTELGPAIAFRLEGKSSNRDAIGAAVTVETGSRRQTRSLQAGSGFLAQHSKELFFGLGEAKQPVVASIRWPSGLVQQIRDLPLNHRVWVEEGAPPSRVEPFKPRAGGVPSAAAVIPGTAALPRLTESWLLAPIAAPDFSLPDVAGRIETLSARRGKLTLLYFWSAASHGYERSLEEFNEAYARWAREGVQTAYRENR